MLRAPPFYLIIQLVIFQVIAMLCIFFLMFLALWGLDFAGYIMEYESLMGYSVVASSIAGAWVLSIAHDYSQEVESVEEEVEDKEEVCEDSD